MFWRMKRIHQTKALGGVLSKELPLSEPFCTQFSCWHSEREDYIYSSLCLHFDVPNQVCEPTSDLWSRSAVAWSCEAYCKFQSTSSTEGRDEDSRDKHLLVSETTVDRDSWDEVPMTMGSMMRFCSSWLLKDMACQKEMSDLWRSRAKLEG